MARAVRFSVCCIVLWSYFFEFAAVAQEHQAAGLASQFHSNNVVQSQQRRHDYNGTRKDVYMLVLVTSPAHLPHRRKWQRQQWRRSLQLLKADLTLPNVDFVFKFCIGGQNISRGQYTDLVNEQRQFGDLRVLDSLDFDHEPFQEIGAFGKSATTTKVLAAIQWATRNFMFRYLLRLGDDAYFKPEVFIRQAKLGLLPTRLACICYVVPAMIYHTAAGEVRAPYPSGMGFVITYDVALWLSKAESMLLWGAPEDGMIGVWFAGTRVQLHHHDGFRDVSWQCRGEDLLVHVLRDAEAWSKIDDQGNMPCGNEPHLFY